MGVEILGVWDSEFYSLLSAPLALAILFWRFFTFFFKKSIVGALLKDSALLIIRFTGYSSIGSTYNRLLNRGSVNEELLSISCGSKLSQLDLLLLHSSWILYEFITARGVLDIYENMRGCGVYCWSTWECNLGREPTTISIEVLL